MKHDIEHIAYSSVAQLLIAAPGSIIEAKRGASAGGISRVRWNEACLRGSSGNYGAEGGSAVMLDGLCNEMSLLPYKRRTFAAPIKL